MRALIRKSATWISLLLLTGVLLPVISEFFIEWAKEKSLYERPSQKVSSAMSAIETVTESWLFALALGVFVGVAIVLWVVKIFPESEARQQSGEEIGKFDRKAQQQLLEKLKEYEHPNNNVKIEIANVTHVPLGETLASVFRLAGWETNYNSTPQEHFTHKYWEGIQIIGYNSHLVNAVASALDGAGVPVRNRNIGENKISKTNPKWPYVEHKIRIRIGHH